MKKRERNTVFDVASTRTFKSEDPSPGHETWDSEDTTVVLASDAEDAIGRVREFWNRDDRADGTIKRRTAFVINSVTHRATLGII